MPPEDHHDGEEREDQHTSEVRQIGELDDVTLTLDDGTEIETACTRKTRHNSEGVNIEQQDNWYFDAPEGEYRLSISEGLSGTEGESPYPIHFPLTKEWMVEYSSQVDAEAIMGYVTAVEIHG